MLEGMSKPGVKAVVDTRLARRMHYAKSRGRTAHDSCQHNASTVVHSVHTSSSYDQLVPPPSSRGIPRSFDTLLRAFACGLMSQPGHMLSGFSALWPQRATPDLDFHTHTTMSSGNTTAFGWRHFSTAHTASSHEGMEIQYVGVDCKGRGTCRQASLRRAELQTRSTVPMQRARCG